MINKWDLPNNREAPLSTTTGPSPNPSPAGRGVITEIPLTSCCSLLVVLFAVVSHVFLHSLSPYFICLNTSVQYVHSVYLCLSVILSINIKAQSGPSPVGVCQNVYILFFMHKAPTFSSQGFAIS